MNPALKTYIDNANRTITYTIIVDDDFRNKNNDWKLRVLKLFLRMLWPKKM